MNVSPEVLDPTFIWVYSKSCLTIPLILLFAEKHFKMQNKELTQQKEY